MKQKNKLAKTSTTEKYKRATGVSDVYKLATGTVSISAKCSDLFSAVFKDTKGNETVDYDGYVPGFFPDQHFGDYVMLNIDLKTGKILNWKQPSVAELEYLKTQSRR